MIKWKNKSMKNTHKPTNKTGLITDNIRFIRSNPLSTPLSEMITVHELIKMNEELIQKYPSLEGALKTIAHIIECELE